MFATVAYRDALGWHWKNNKLESFPYQSVENCNFPNNVTTKQTHSLGSWSPSHTHARTHRANRPADGLILAADIVIKQLNHWQAPRRNCTRARVWFQRPQRLVTSRRKSSPCAVTPRAHSTPPIDTAIPRHAYFSVRKRASGQLCVNQ